ncbi:MAG: glycosyltransferase [Clostridium sp.]|uniref:glycosyltransferase n=1 Tax=Clostridium sp. TaxID=1506 RepID=UPI003F3827FE
MRYSICIRTLGTAGEKFEKLINSIKGLNTKPEEIIIVIPKGYILPQINMENTRIIYSEKGMLLQRIIGYEEANTEFILLLDDDVQFDKNLVDELMKPIEEGRCKVSFPIYKDLLLQGGIRRVISAITLSSIPNKKDKETFVKIMDSGGFTYNCNLSESEKYLYSESAPGMCVFAERKALLDVNLREDLWIDRTEYPLREDAVLIYKLHLNNNKVIGVQDINIVHLDGGGEEHGRNLKAAYSNGYNQILFWKRFIYTNKKGMFNKFKSKLTIRYWAASTIIYLSLRYLINKDKDLLRESIYGINNGFKSLKKRRMGEEKIWQL